MQIIIYPNNGKSYDLLSETGKAFLKKYIKVYSSQDTLQNSTCALL